MTKRIKQSWYVDNKELTAMTIEFVNNLPEPMTDALAKLIYKVAKNTSVYGFFIHYNADMKEELVQHAAYTVLKRLHNFKIDKNNAFAYITSICMGAMISYLKTENKYERKKYANAREVALQIIREQGETEEVEQLDKYNAKAYDHAMTKKIEHKSNKPLWKPKNPGRPKKS